MEFDKTLVKEILEGKVKALVVGSLKEEGWYPLKAKWLYGYVKINKVEKRTCSSFSHTEATRYGYFSKATLLNQVMRRGDLSINDSTTPVYLLIIEEVEVDEKGKELLKPKPKKKKSLRGKWSREILGKNGEPITKNCPHCDLGKMVLKRRSKSSRYWKCIGCGKVEDVTKIPQTKGRTVILPSGEEIGIDFCSGCGKKGEIRRKPKSNEPYLFCPKCGKKSHDYPEGSTLINK